MTYVENTFRLITNTKPHCIQPHFKFILEIAYILTLPRDNILVIGAAIGFRNHLSVIKYFLLHISDANNHGFPEQAVGIL
jgi:hypothetical protein